MHVVSLTDSASLAPSSPKLRLFMGLEFDWLLPFNRPLQAVQADIRIAGMLGSAIVLGYLYQGPPFR